MVYNVVEYFRSLQNPKLCKGGCGFILEEEFSTCETCKKKILNSRQVEKIVKFRENIKEIINNLTEITEANKTMYNKEMCYIISQELGLKIYKKK